MTILQSNINRVEPGSGKSVLFIQMIETGLFLKVKLSIGVAVVPPRQTVHLHEILIATGAENNIAIRNVLGVFPEIVAATDYSTIS